MAAGTNRWRQRLFDRIEGPKVLEVGVGTGANLASYPGDLEITAIDFSPNMLRYARRRASELGLSVELLEMDVQSLDFPSACFDTVLTTCVFCSVPDPGLGLREIHRVLKPTGVLLMLEHVLSDKAGLKQLMNLINPVAVRLSGANINRQTKENLLKAGFSVEEENLWLDVLKLFIARKSENAGKIT